MSAEIALAVALAADIHGKQVDKGGHPYIWHPIRVAQNPRVVRHGEQAQIIALLHDTIEDCEEKGGKYTVDYVKQLIDNQFGHQVLAGVLELTHHEGSYMEYIESLIDYGATDLMDIKMADQEDNMNILRQPSLELKDIQRLQRYHVAYGMLRDQVSPI